MNASTHSTCPKCHAAVPEDAPDGLCPKCALESAVAAASTRTTSFGITPPPTVEEIAPHFPEFEIIGLLGAGGMGAVYQARQPQLDRFVALKILSHDLASDPAFVERFNREARLLARLSHPNIVGIHDFGTAGPYCYLLMEYIDGVNLRQAMQAGTFTPAESLAMVEEICAALKYAHEEGILHRDIKPENILIDSKGRVKIADFGIAKLVGEAGRQDLTLTMQGSILGSPHYMAPEQFESPGDVDQRADIYSLGVVFYEMLTGELPIGRFAAPSTKATMDARIDEIVFRTLEKERAARFQTAEEVRTSVAGIAQNPPSMKRETAQVAQADTSAAKFSLSSAILTGISLVLAAFVVWFGETMLNPLMSLRESDPAGYQEQLRSGLPIFILAVSSLIALVSTALVGFILGCKALSTIRKSGGTRTGVGYAIFAVVPWMVNLLTASVVSLIYLPMAKSSSPDASPFLNEASWVMMILAGLVMAHGLHHWARGVASKDGEKRFPGLLRSILASVGVTILSFVLMAVVSHVQPDKRNGGELTFDKMQEQARQNAKALSSKVPNGNLTGGNVGWSNGFPEALLPVVLEPGIRGDFRLVLYDGTDQNPRYFPIGTLLGIDLPPGVALRATEIRNVRYIVEIGTTGPKGEAGDGKRGITGLLESIGVSRTIPVESDTDDWEFNLGQNAVLLENPEKITIQVATRKAPGQGNVKIDETLKLEINVSRY
jgi:serine/threonine protein kinase